jgi:glucokinase
VAVIAVDCGGTKLAYGSVAVPGAAPEEVYAVATPPSAASIPARIIEAIGPLIDPTITGVGIGIAGLVDADAGTLVWMPHVSGARIPVADPVGRALGIAATVDNDANLAALAEARAGAGAGYRMVLMITIGTGIGMGLAIEGEIERGRGSLGEAGHMTIDPEGPPCPCGRRGCWEAVVSGRVLDRVARRMATAAPDGAVARAAGGAGATGAHLAAAAEQGDEASRRALAEAGKWLGHGVASLVAVLDPDVVVIGGGVSAAGDHLLEPARRTLADSLSGRVHRAETPLVAASFGAQSGLVGGGLIAEESSWAN